MEAISRDKERIIRDIVNYYRFWRYVRDRGRLPRPAFGFSKLTQYNNRPITKHIASIMSEKSMLQKQIFIALDQYYAILKRRQMQHVV